jgi:uncharacterized membrane protein (UPF0127 family)
MPQKAGYFLVSRTSTQKSNTPQTQRKANKLPFTYRLANTQQSMWYGFQFSCAETIAKTQILFQFKSPLVPSFHMNNVIAPLDIAFIDKEGFIIDILQMKTYKPNKERPLYKPSAPALYALEAHIGYFVEKDVKVGDQVLLP